MIDYGLPILDAQDIFDWDTNVNYHWRAFGAFADVHVDIYNDINDELNGYNDEIYVRYKFDNSINIKIDIENIDMNFIMPIFNKALKLAYDKYNEFKEYESIP